MKHEFIIKLVAILEQLATSNDIFSEEECGVLELEDACDKNDSDLIKWGCHVIRHFLDDEDLRSTDPNYDKRMKKELQELSDKIRKEYLI